MDRPTHAGLRHLALNVARMDEMKRFYIDLLGFSVEWEPDPDNVYLSSGLDNLALHRMAPVTSEVTSAQGAAARSGDPGAGYSSLDHFGMIVRTADDVDRWAAFLESRGVTLDAKPRTHRDGARSCYFSDPDANKIQVIFHPPISGKA